jgi:hypothetical protein
VQQQLLLVIFALICAATLNYSQQPFDQILIKNMINF